jgi:hypothetical protein
MLTPEQATFVQYFIQHGHALQAAVAAGASLQQAEQQATHWLLIPEVITSIQLGIQASAFDKAKAQKHVLNHALALATSDITEGFYLTPEGLQVRSLNEMPPSLRVAIKKLKIVETPVPWDDKPKRTVTMELHSKTDAIAQVVKMLGMASPDRINVTINDLEAMDEDQLNVVIQQATKIGSDNG